MPARLVVTKGPDLGSTFLLKAGADLKLGRSRSATFILTDPTVSRIHCDIDYDGERTFLINASTNGTLLNQQPIGREVLEDGDVLRLGNTELQFIEGEDEEPSTVLPVKVAVGTGAPQPLGELVGQALAHFAIESIIAKGSSGYVFQACDTRNQARVALKVLYPEKVARDPDRRRFVRAMKTMLPLRHENLVALVGAGKTGPYCWAAMEFVDGESMTQVIQRIGVAGMLDWRYSYRVAVHIGRALEYAHGQSIIHRNITPRNILFKVAAKQALLGDLMLAKALEGQNAAQITAQGEVLGEIAYLAPEQTTGGSLPVDERADLYSLGATLYALLTGRPPFMGHSQAELVRMIRNDTPRSPREFQMAIPDQFAGIVLKLLAKRPDDRYPSAKALRADLERIGKLLACSV
jgi:serine/threonine protein kinase